MSGEFEAAGALATAGLVGGAIEGKGPGEAVDGACLNCGAKLEGRFCSNCGQSAHPHRTLFGVLEEFLHGVIHFDTKAWRTLPMVIFRPGTLTRNYVYGQRARYISPLALFLFTIFFMFFAFAFVEMPGLNDTPAEQRAEALQEIEESRADLAKAERELAEARAAPPPTDGTPADLPVRLAQMEVDLALQDVQRREAQLRSLDERLAAAARREAAEAARREAAEGGPAVQIGITESSPTAPAPTPAEGAATEATPPAAGSAPAETPTAQNENAANDENNIGWNDNETWQEGIARSAREGRINILPQFPELNARMVKKLENPDLALYKVQQTAYKFSFLLVPISLPFIALLFLWKRGTTFYDHVVYALYALSFASLLFVAIIFLAKSNLTSWVAGWLIGLGLPIHTFFHLGGAYKLGWWSALWRTLFMLIFAIIILTFFLVAIFLLGLA